MSTMGKIWIVLGGVWMSFGWVIAAGTESHYWHRLRTDPERACRSASPTVLPQSARTIRPSSQPVKHGEVGRAGPRDTLPA